ncbi:ABC transporter B family member 11-like isoform X2 [Amaranthus tricolor]|uniref:ABC transporter B family member 11-like isoform X2 n=1 Tax=Amaranthus tricolor TaxID=29722 RepID=UPI0025856D67|nr:ABC transporter B family member 11-like isoform X2 [Amaranthus tricolor]
MKEMNEIEKATTSSLEEQEDATKHDKESKKVEGNMDKKKVPFYKMFSFADSIDKTLMIIGSIGAIANGVAMPLMAILLGDFVDAFGQNQNSKQIVHVVSKVSLKFAYLAVGTAIVAFLQVACWMITGERQAARMRNLYLKTILRQDIAFFDKEITTGEVIGRMSGDTVLIQDALGEKVGQFIQLIATFIGGFVVAFVRGWLLTIVMLSVIPFLATAAAFMTIFISKMATKGQTSYAKAAVVVEQTLGSIRTVASFTGEKEAIGKYNKAVGSAYKAGIQEGVTTGLGLGVVTFIIFSSYALAIWFGSRMILRGHYTGGDVINVIVGVIIGSMSLGQASPSMTAFAAGQAAAYKMFETINKKPDIDPFDPNGKVLEDIHGDITFKDVSFSYPTRLEEHIFNGFSLTISSGTTAALVGQSGSGKSTVISLIERFYDPQAGEVLIDGINIKEFQLRWIRQKISLVSQEPVLFGLSIKDNIAYGKDGATIEEIKAAAEFANAAKFIDKLPQGLDTLVGEHGTQLSGGQKQRVAIARAILKDPRILLLDEATSALDAESERIVQEALDRIMVNRTTVIVAHRLSTIRNADMIAVIHQGKVVEKGVHSELLKDPNGAYSQLIHLQEIRKESEQPKDARELSSQSSLKRSSLRSLSRGSSSGRISSARISLSAMSGLLGADPVETSVGLPPSEEQSEVSIKRLASLNKPETPILMLGCIAAIASGAVFPVFSIIFANAIEMFYKPAPILRKDSRFWSLMFVVIGLGGMVSYPARSYFFAVAGCKLIRRIRTLCFEKVLHMEIGWFDEPENSSGAIGARLSADAATKKYEEASQVANDAVGSIRTVASFCAEEKIMHLYEMKCEAPIQAGIKRGLVSGVGFGVAFACLFGVYGTCFYAGAQLVSHGKTTFTEVFQVFFALAMASVGISQTSSLAPDTSKAKIATASVFAILDRQSKINPSDESGQTSDNVKGDIELRHVRFTYPTRPNVQIFQNLCLTIHARKTVALVGESGSGKSTVISLLQRFYDPDSGVITLDGIEIQKLQLKWLRQQMGLVSQEPVLFNETIRGNIAYGKEGNATEDEIVNAAKLANAHNFISSLQEGYDTLVGERGVQLSGGQKQRVAIARAIIKNPRILLLDEATSALDAESERVVQDALDQFMVNRTTIVVAHRLSTIKNAHVIAVIKNGVVAEKGNHETLLHIKDGLYASLVALHICGSS